jgi:hypothetical protein
MGRRSLATIGTGASTTQWLRSPVVSRFWVPRWKEKWAADKGGEAISIFHSIFESSKLWNSKQRPSLCQNIFKLGMRLDLTILNNFLNWVWLQIPNKIHVIILGTYSNLNLLWILKGSKPCGKNLVNSPKIYLDMLFTTMNLVGHTCMQEIGVPIQVSKWLDLKIRKRVWIWKFKAHNTYNTNKTILEFYSTFQFI